MIEKAAVAGRTGIGAPAAPSIVSRVQAAVSEPAKAVGGKVKEAMEQVPLPQVTTPQRQEIPVMMPPGYKGAPTR